MTETIDAILERISPEHVKEQVKDRIREVTVGRAQWMVSKASHTARDAGVTLVRVVKQNPVILAAVAVFVLGWLIIWLMIRGLRGSSED